MNKSSVTKLCSTCLSTDRRLVPIKTLQSVLINLNWLDIDFSMDEDHLCWECRAVLLKIYRFRNQVLDAQEVFRLHRDLAEPFQSQTLSKLTKHTKEGYDAEYNEEIKEDKDGDDFDCEETVNECTNQVIINAPIEITQNDNKIGAIEMYQNNVDFGAIGANCQHDVDSKKKLTEMKFSKDEERFIVKIMSVEEMYKARDLSRNASRYKVSPYKCKKCITGYFSEEKYKTHLADRHSDTVGKHKCSICEVRFTRRDAMEYHLQCHYRRYQCKLCSYNHHKLATMLIHLTREHDKERKYICDVCKKILDSPSALRYHRDISHKELPKCEYCGKTCRTKHNLKVHLLCHSGGMPLLECPQCGKKYKGRGSLRAHLRTHSQAPDELAYCAECDAQYKSVYLYRRHLVTHTRHRQADVLKFACTHCDAKFVNRATLTRHVTAKHLKNYPYSCHVCSKSFMRKDRLTSHVMEKHEGVPRPKDKICTYCGKGFKDRQVLVNHIRTHTGEKPFQCEYCASSFAQRSALTTHVRALHLKLPKLAKS